MLFYRKTLTNKRIEQLERQNKILEKQLKDEKEKSGTYRITINEQDGKIKQLELKIENLIKFAKKLEVTNRQIDTTSKK